MIGFLEIEDKFRTVSFKWSFDF